MGLELQDIDFLRSHRWSSLAEVNCSRNLIANIDVLNGFHQLTFIDASNNYIKSVNLNLKHLVQLHLHNNFIDKFPSLPKSKGLRYLNLNANKLTSPEGLEAKHTPKINELNLGNNSIKFNTQVQLSAFIMNLTKFGELKNLTVSDNPFMTEHDRKTLLNELDVRKYICDNLKSLDNLNGMAL